MDNINTNDHDVLWCVNKRMNMGKWIIALLMLSTSCTTSNKVLSAHGQESDYHVEQLIDKVNK